MFPARGEFTKLGKGSLMLDLLDPITQLPTGLQFLGNASAIAISSDVQTAELFSNTQASGAKIASTRTRVDYNVTATLNEYTLENLALFLGGTLAAANQTLQVGATFGFNAVEGKYFSLGARKITAVSGVKTAGAVALVLGTDYDLNAEHGMVLIRPGSPVITDGDPVVFTFSKAVQNIRRLRIGQAGAQVGRLVYLADDANVDGKSAHDKLEIWKVAVNPDGELNVISDDYGSFNITMGVTADGTNHPTEPYGYLERVE